MKSNTTKSGGGGANGSIDFTNLGQFALNSKVGNSMKEA